MTAPALTLAFRDFLPGWIAAPALVTGRRHARTRPVGLLRLEDPAGEVGIETHLLTAGAAVYQIPMSYRGAPLRQLADGRTADTSVALIAGAEHSELGPRWIYDASYDPVWVTQLGRLLATQGALSRRVLAAG